MKVLINWIKLERKMNFGRDIVLGKDTIRE